MKDSILVKLKDSILPGEGIKRFASDKYPLIYSSEKSKTGYNIPELVMKYGSGPPRFALKTFPVMFSTIKQARKSYKDAVKNPVNPKKKAEDGFIEELVEYAKSLGVLDVGFAKINPDYIFKGSAVLYENAIVVTMEMGKGAIAMAPSKVTGHEIHRTYNGLGNIVNKIAEYLRQKGYGAQAGPALCGDVNYVLLAEKAGLGAIGTHGLLISPKVGPRQRIAAVYTSIENLPFSKKNEYLWIKNFCEKCKKCVRVCPAGAIYEKPENDYSDTVKHIDYKKCAVPFSSKWGCTVCIKECTFNNTDYEKIKNASE